MHMNQAASRCLLLLATLVAGCEAAGPPVEVSGGRPELGRIAMERYGCAACHTIPAMHAYGANVGPPLSSMSARAYVAGVVPNTPENLVRWLLDPPSVDPRTAMPKLGLTHAEASDIAAYLYASR